MATVFVEVRLLKDAPPITGSDMKTYGPFREGRVYAIPKANARVFIKHGIAKATRKEAGKPTLKEMFKGEVLTPYIEAAKVKPLIPEAKLNTGKLADIFLELLKKAGVSLPSRFKGEFEVALDINKSYEENVKLIEAAAQRIILLERTKRVLGEIREARGAKVTPLRAPWIKPILEFVTEKTIVEGWAKEEDVYDEMERRGATKEEIKEALSQLVREGSLYSPKHGFLRKT